MARIEISLEEYELLKNDNANLYNENVNLRKENELLSQDKAEAIELLEDIKETSFFERVFQWGRINAILKRYFDEDNLTISPNEIIDIEETKEE